MHNFVISGTTDMKCLDKYGVSINLCRNYSGRMALIVVPSDLSLKRSNKQDKQLWENLISFRSTIERIGICVLCSNLEAISIYDAYTTRKLLDRVNIFTKMKNTFAHMLVTNITKSNLFDCVHLLPISTHLYHPEMPLPEEAVQRDLANIRDHLAYGWGVIIVKPSKADEGDASSFLFPSNPLSALFNTNIKYSWTENGETLPKTTSQGQFIEKVLGELRNIYNNKGEENYDCEKNVQLNIKREIRQPVLSIAHYLQQHLLDEKDIFTFGNFVCTFSPSYNLRIVAPNEEGYAFIMKYLERYACKQYAALINVSIFNPGRKRRAEITASMIYNLVFAFFCGIKVPICSIEHYYRFRFIKMQYGLHSAQTANELFSHLDCRRDSFIDLYVRGDYLVFEGRELSLEDFSDNKCYESKVMNARNQSSTAARLGERRKIDEINLLDPLRKILDYLSSNSPQKLFLQPFTFSCAAASFPWQPKRSSNITTIQQCLDFILEQHSVARDPTGVISKTIRDVLGYYYSSYTFFIYEEFRKIRKYEEELKTLKEAEGKVQRSLDRLLSSASDVQLFVFTVWFFQQLSFIAFLKGNFFLLEILLHILQDNKEAIANLSRSPKKKAAKFIFHQFFGENGFDGIYNDGNRVAIHLKYCEIYNMIILPSPAVIEAVMLLAQNATVLRPKKFLERVQGGIELFYPISLHLLDLELVNSLNKKVAHLAAINLEDPPTQNECCYSLLKKLELYSVAKLLVDLVAISDSSRKTYWAEFCRIISFRDGSEVQGALWNCFARKEFWELEFLFSVNVLFSSPSVFFPKLVKYQQLTMQEVIFLRSLLSIFTVSTDDFL